jgi:hypothetical protein
MKDKLWDVYDRWVTHNGIAMEYKERMGALAMLLWLRERDLLKTDKASTNSLVNKGE